MVRKKKNYYEEILMYAFMFVISYTSRLLIWNHCWNNINKYSSKLPAPITKRKLFITICLYDCYACNIAGWCALEVIGFYRDLWFIKIIKIWVKNYMVLIFCYHLCEYVRCIIMSSSKCIQWCLVFSLTFHLIYHSLSLFCQVNYW